MYFKLIIVYYLDYVFKKKKEMKMLVFKENKLLCYWFGYILVCLCNLFILKVIYKVFLYILVL